MSDTVQHLGVEFGSRFNAAVLPKSDEAKLVTEELTKLGLAAQPERAHLFNVFSPDSLKSVAVSITPFSSKDLSREGGLSLSEGGHAQAVVVDLKGNEVTGFSHFAVTGGKVVTTHHTIAELARGGHAGSLDEDKIKTFAEHAGRVKAAKPLIEIQPRQARTMATVSYNDLLGDQFSKSVHSVEDIRNLRGQSNIVAEIALFVLFRTQGSACCSCSCSCWGSSSCSSSAV